MGDKPTPFLVIDIVPVLLYNSVQMKYNSRIETRIDESTKERLRARAARHGLKLSQLVRMILVQWDEAQDDEPRTETR